MDEKLVRQFINPREEFNTTFYGAWGIERRVKKFGLWCLRHRLMPLATDGVVLRAAPGETPEAILETNLFEHDGPLYTRPMNFYVRLRNGDLLNCGFLMHHFMCGEATGYGALAKLVRSK